MVARPATRSASGRRGRDRGARGEARAVRPRQLHHALTAFAEEAAELLAGDTAAGAEISFELDVRRGRDAPLYCYRPLTAEFIEERAPLLGRLPSFPPAVHALAACGGLDAYLVERGETELPRDARGRAERALGCFLSRCFAEATDFALAPERLGAALAELDAVLLEGRAPLAEVVVPVCGLALATDVVPLAEGLELLGAAAADDLPPGCPDDAVLARVSWEAAPGDPAPLAHAQVRLRRALTGLRLYDAAPVTFGPTGWTRTGGGPWRAFAPLRAAAEPRAVLALPPGQEDELRAFCSLVARRTPRQGELAWALRRFELAAERACAGEALTDVLLALRALLADPDGSLLAERVAAVCAVPENADAVRESVARAVALERAVVTGVGPDPAALEPVVDELGGYLRAILRDVLCGHLDPDVRGLADRLIAQKAAAASSSTLS